MESEREKANNSSESKSEKAKRYIHSLHMSLLDITQPYRRPLSSILPEERQVESSLLFDDIEIEGLSEKFSSWEGTISKKKIRDWLNQFETTLERNIAYLLLSKLQFFSKGNIESATRSLREKLLDLLLTKDSLWEAFGKDKKVALKSEVNFKIWLRNNVIRYAELPPPPNTSVESQHTLWAIYKRAALTGISVPHGNKMKLLREYFEAGAADPETSVFVFMDYTNGSGNQLSKCIGKINKLLKEYPAYRQSFFVFMYVVQAESFDLGSVKSAPENCDNIYYEPMLDYKSREIVEILDREQISGSEYDKFVKKYCLRASGKSSAGYRDSGALTCHYYSCPNNTLPFFHEDKNWEPLFENSQTPSATRYKKKR